MRKDSFSPNIIPATISALLITIPLQVHANETIRFEVIKSDSGKRHISNIPSTGYNKSGHVKDSHNPNSIVFQYAEMVRSLQEESMEISRTQEDLPPGPDTGTGITQDMEDNSRSDLEKLIELEKRGGRTEPDSGN